MVAGQEGVADGGAGDDHGGAGQGRADAEPVVVREQAEQVQRGQVRGAGAGLDCLPGGVLPGRPERGVDVGGGQDAGGAVEQDGPVALADEAPDVCHGGGAALDAGDELLVLGEVRSLLLERGAQLGVVAGIDPQPGAGAARGVRLELGDRGEEVGGVRAAVLGEGGLADEHGDDRVAELPVGQPAGQPDHDPGRAGGDVDSHVQLHPQPHLLLGAGLQPVPVQCCPGLAQASRRCTG